MSAIDLEYIKRIEPRYISISNIEPSFFECCIDDYENHLKYFVAILYVDYFGTQYWISVDKDGGFWIDNKVYYNVNESIEALKQFMIDNH